AKNSYGQTKTTIQENSENNLYAQALSKPRVKSFGSPLGAEYCGYSGSEGFYIERGTRFADDQCADDATCQPNSSRYAPKTWRERIHRHKPGISHGVPKDEDQSAGYCQDGSNNDIYNPPI